LPQRRAPRPAHLRGGDVRAEGARRVLPARPAHRGARGAVGAARPLRARSGGAQRGQGPHAPPDGDGLLPGRVGGTMRFLERLRLGHKLALSLSMAALLPVAAAAVVSVSIVLRGLERGLAEQTTRQLRVGMNLVLRTVERLGGDAQRLASTPGLGAAVGQGEPARGGVLTRELPPLPSAMVRVADDKGPIVAQRAVGGDEPRFGDIGVPAAVVEAGLAYERRVTLTPGQGMLVVHAVAPIVDPSLALRGVVVVSLPLDGDFADGIKGALGTDVLIYAGADPAISSFLDHDGARLHGLSAPGDVAERVLAGGTLQIRATIAGEEFSLGY